LGRKNGIENDDILDVAWLREEQVGRHFLWLS